jgi:hypothetical protein
MKRKIFLSLVGAGISLAIHAQLTSSDVTILFDGSNYGTSASNFVYESHAANNSCTKEMVGHQMQWTVTMGTPNVYDALGLYSFAAKNLAAHNKIVAKIQLTQYNKGFGIELRGLAYESAVSEVDWLDTVIAGQTELWTNGNRPGSDTKTDVVPTTGGEWEFFEYEILNWYCAYPAHARIDSSKIVKLTPYYGYKSAVPIEGDVIVIDYIVMVPPGTSTSDVDAYMATVDTGPNAIENTGKSELKMFPNPAGEILCIQEAEQIASVVIINSVGQKVIAASNNKSNEMKLNVSALESGIYFAQIGFLNGSKETMKVVIK